MCAAPKLHSRTKSLNPRGVFGLASFHQPKPFSLHFTRVLVATGWAVDYLDAAACDWAPEEINLVDWVFNASPVLKERAEMMALHEGRTYQGHAEKRAPYLRQ
jgi:hypothetical protein